MYATLLAAVFPMLAPLGPMHHRHDDYRHGCSTARQHSGWQHCQSCRWNGCGTCYDYRRYFNYPWHPPRPFFVIPHDGPAALPDIIRISPDEEVIPYYESSPSDRR